MLGVRATPKSYICRVSAASIPHIDLLAPPLISASTALTHLRALRTGMLTAIGAFIRRRELRPALLLWFRTAHASGASNANRRLLCISVWEHCFSSSWLYGSFVALKTTRLTAQGPRGSCHAIARMHPLAVGLRLHAIRNGSLPSFRSLPSNVR